MPWQGVVLLQYIEAVFCGIFILGAMSVWRWFRPRVFLGSGQTRGDPYLRAQLKSGELKQGAKMLPPSALGRSPQFINRYYSDPIALHALDIPRARGP